MKPTRLLADDGTASMATMIMLSHHAFRRDLARFAEAFTKPNPERADAVRGEWQQYCDALRGHHEKEDSDIFPHIGGGFPELREPIERLSAQHAQIDPLLERIGEALADPRTASDAAALVRELDAHIDMHLDDEEATIIPLLRGAREFPTPPNDDAAALFADGFAWAMQGIAPAVLAEVEAMLPEVLRARLPAARAAFAARCERVWGCAIPDTSSETSIPERARPY